MQRFDLLLADGMPVVWSSRMHRRPVPERVAGADLVPALAPMAARRGLTLGLLGGPPGIAAAAAEALAARFPGLQVRSWNCPWLDDVEDMDPEVLDAVGRERPDILLVALGHPKQEKWSARYATEVGAAVTIGVGASFGFLAGTVRRAPRWMQRSGLEWFHRLVHEPRRLAGRYAADGAHLALLAPRARSTHRAGPPTVPAEHHGDLLIVRPEGRLALPEDCCAARIEVDLARVPEIDAHDVAELVSLAVSCHTQGRQLRVVRPSPQARSIIESLMVGELLTMASWAAPVDGSPHRRSGSTAASGA